MSNPNQTSYQDALNKAKEAIARLPDWQREALTVAMAKPSNQTYSTNNQNR